MAKFIRGRRLRDCLLIITPDHQVAMEMPCLYPLALPQGGNRRTLIRPATDQLSASDVCVSRTVAKDSIPSGQQTLCRRDYREHSHSGQPREFNFERIHGIVAAVGPHFYGGQEMKKQNAAGSLLLGLLVFAAGALAQTAQQAAHRRAQIPKISRRTLTCCAPMSGSRKPR